MSISITKKQEIIQHLLATKTKAYQVEVKLLLKRKPEEAGEVKIRGKKLSRKIDDLIGQSMSDWIGNADTIVSDVRLTNKKVQSSINEINKNIRVVNNVIRLVGFIDEIVDIVDGIT